MTEERKRLKEILEATRGVVVVRPRTLRQAIKEGLLPDFEAEEILEDLKAKKKLVELQSEIRNKTIYIFYDPQILARRSNKLYKELCIYSQIEKGTRKHEPKPLEWLVIATAGEKDTPKGKEINLPFKNKTQAEKHARLLRNCGYEAKVIYKPYYA